MPFITEQELEHINQTFHYPCISLYLPAYEARNPRRSNALRESLLSEALRGIADLSTPRSNILRRRMEIFSRNRASFQREAHSIALFLTADDCRAYSMPMSIEGDVVIGEQPNTKPLRPLVVGRSSFFILSYGEEQTRFLVCDDDNSTELDLSQLFIPRPGDYRHPIHRIAGGMRSVLLEESAPLIFAGPRELRRVFRALCSFPGLHSEMLRGNWERRSNEQLHRAGRLLLSRDGGSRGAVDTFSSPSLPAEPPLALAI